MQICGAFCLLLFELLMEYFAGAILTKRLLKNETNAGLSILTGFFVYQILFQILALGVMCTTRVLHHLSVLWGICLLVLVPCSYWYGRKLLKEQKKLGWQWVRQNKACFILFVGTVLAFVYYTCINGELNEDATYYIGLMTTSVETDSLFKYNAYTGLEMESFYLRRALAMFEIHSAVISQITRMHPLILARIFRASQNVILTSIAVYLCAKKIFWQDEESGAAKAMLCGMFFWILQLPFASTIYTPARFLLYRTYEAKAFAANFIVLFGIYLCTKWLRERDRGLVVLLVLYFWGSIALATSAGLVAVVVCGIILVPNILWEKLYAG